jgi:predicted dehydrogenase
MSKTSNFLSSSNSNPIASKGRRKFIRNAAVGTLGFHLVPRFVLGKGYVAPSDKINLGVIGLGKQGNLLSSSFLNNSQAQIVAGSDVWDGKREIFKQNVSEKYAEIRNIPSFQGVETYLDYKEMLERSDIDGIIVATPDHWHAIQSIDAMKAGKDVFCEKPLTNTIQEGIDMVAAVKKYQRVFQTGSMQRSWEIFRKAKEIVSSGKLGPIMQVQVNVGDPARPYDLPNQPIPEGIDWNLWCGPAPLTGYHESIAPKIVKKYPDWRFFKEFGNGILSDWGAHMFDIAQWGLDMDHTGPVKYIPPKDKNAKRGMRMVYANGIEMVHHDFGRGWAVRFIGEKGILDVSRGFLETLPNSILYPDPEKTTDCGFPDRGNHYQDWLSSMKTRKQPICDVEIGHRSATICNIANIAYELGETLSWNPEKEKFTNNSKANKMMKRDNRDY